MKNLDIILLNKKSNMVILYEGNRRDLFMRKGAEGARCEAHLNSQAKGRLPDRTLESFYYLKTPKVQFPIMGNFFWVERQSRVVSQFEGKISQAKRQRKENY